MSAPVPAARRSALRLLLTGSWLLSSLAGCAANAALVTPPPAFAAEDDTAIRAVLATQQAAWNRGDLTGYMDGYTHSNDLVFTSGSKIRRGWDETYAKYQARYGTNPSTMGQLTFEVLGIQSLGAEGAIVLGRWDLTGTPAAGGGIFSVALDRTPDGWKIVHDHTSSDPAPATVPTP